MLLLCCQVSKSQELRTTVLRRIIANLTNINDELALEVLTVLQSPGPPQPTAQSPQRLFPTPEVAFTTQDTGAVVQRRYPIPMHSLPDLPAPALQGKPPMEPNDKDLDRIGKVEADMNHVSLSCGQC